MQLAHQLLTASGSTPERWMYFLHGILGSGSNWRSFARWVVEAHPSWGAVLVDLRMHGRSRAFPPPHTVAAASADLVALEEAVPGPVRGALGHSFGGKVMLAYLQHKGAELTHAFLLDSSPGAREAGRGSEATLDVLATLRGLPETFESKSAFIAALRAAGVGRRIAEWLAMNLEPADGGGQRFSLELNAIQALLDDYFQVDLWPALERLPPTVRMEVVLGQRSGVFGAEGTERLNRLAEANRNLQVHTVAAGHWVHVDDPEGTLRVVTEALRP